MQRIFSIILVCMGVAFPAYGETVPASQPAGSSSSGGVKSPTSQPAGSKKTIERVLVIGNSLTRHPPLADSDWNHDWGMAATRMENDFAHLLHQKLCRYQPNPRPELIVYRLYDPEMLIPGELKKAVDQAADVIVVELGDNLQPEKVDVKKVPEGYANLLKALKEKNPDAVMVATSTWGANAGIDAIMKKASNDQGVIFVEIGDFIRDPRNSAGSEGHFKHPGVAWHPGDRGMKVIADRLWKTIHGELKQKKNPSNRCTTCKVKK